MKIQSLFAKDLKRIIKGVVQVDDTTAKIVWQELDEYVVTRELRRHYDKFFKRYLEAFDHPDDANLTGSVGVWVSGFFGSGKSHFIKMLSYLLKNEAVSNAETGEKRKPSEFLIENLDDHIFTAEIARAADVPADVILFNIDSKADSQRGENALLEVFWRVFNEEQGFSRDSLAIAELERRLTKEGVYEDFKTIFRQTDGSGWEEERDAFYFKEDAIVAALAGSLKISEDAARRYFENADKSLNVTVENFVERVKEYLDQQPTKTRLIFIVDEVGQFIGKNIQLMLKLQTLVEDLGSRCGGRAWVIVTSQEDVEAVLGELNRNQRHDFSKILGRFPTHLKLSSIDIDEVIQERLLKKTDEAEIVLQAKYNEKAEILRHQIVFSGGTTMNGFQSESEFVKSYPFVPYQFKLVQKIFESIRKFGAAGAHLSQGERSMLNAFQNAANAVSGKDTGALVPLYEFFPTIEGALETAVALTINHSATNPKLEEFDGKVLRVLFLLRYVETFKTNLENLVTLFIDQIDADRLKIRSRLDESLIRLENESLINRNGEEYFFLTDDEQRVSKEIRDINLSDTDEIRKISELVFEEIASGAGKYRFPLNRKDYEFNLITDGVPYKRLIDDNLSLKIISPLHSDYEYFNDAKGVGQSAEAGGAIVVKMGKPGESQKGKGFASELRIYLQTDKFYTTRHTIDAPENLKRILSARKEENGSREKRLLNYLDEMLQTAEIFALGQKLPNKAAGAAKQYILEAQKYIVTNTFSKLEYLVVENKDWEKEIKAVLQADNVVQNALMETEQDYAPALREIREYVKLQSSLNRRIGLDELVAYFGSRPYGWIDYSVVWLVAKIFVAGEINLVVDSDNLEPKAAVEYLTKSRNWKSVTIREKRVADAGTLDFAGKLAHEIFGMMPPDKEGELEQFWRDRLSVLLNELNGDLRLAQTGNYVGKSEIEDAIEKISKVLAVRDGFDFLNNLRERANDLRDLKDETEDLRQFYSSQIKVWERLQDGLKIDLKPNRQFLEQDGTIAPKLIRLDEIAAAVKPYAMLREVDELLAGVKEANEKLLEEERRRAQAEIEPYVEKIKSGLDELSIDGELRFNILRPIQLLKQRVDTTNSLTTMRYGAATELAETVEKAEEALENERIRRLPDDTPPPKPVFNIKPAQLSTKTYLETEREVDEFLGRLRETMVKAINDEQRVKIN